MPNPKTFSIKPIAALLTEEMGSGLWIDPFANSNKLATITNDLNPAFDTTHHMDAIDFLRMFKDASVDGGVLYDPPYSPRQIAEVYQRVGMVKRGMEYTQASFWSDQKREIGRICKSGAKVVTCGWNSGGIGKKYGFEITRILLVPHGGWHNDTIVTVEVRI